MHSCAMRRDGSKPHTSVHLYEKETLSTAEGKSFIILVFHPISMAILLIFLLSFRGFVYHLHVLTVACTACKVRLAPLLLLSLLLELGRIVIVFLEHP